MKGYNNSHFSVLEVPIVKVRLSNSLYNDKVIVCSVFITSTKQ